MSTNPINLQAKLNSMRYKADLKQRIECSTEENKKYREMEKRGIPLPSDVFEIKKNPGHYYRVHIPTELTEAEKNEYILLMQLNELREIQKGVHFLVAWTVVCIILSILSFLFFLRR